MCFVNGVEGERHALDMPCLAAQAFVQLLEIGVGDFCGFFDPHVGERARLRGDGFDFFHVV